MDFPIARTVLHAGAPVRDAVREGCLVRLWLKRLELSNLGYACEAHTRLRSSDPTEEG